jgi:uncharacterized phiE125 gp8 family phage protein
MKVKIITPVVTEPVSLADARTHLRIEPYGSPPEHPDDLYVETLISVAREWCEQYLQRSLATQTLEVAYDNFTETLYLPNAPIQSVTEVTYVDENGATQTLYTSIYELDWYEDKLKLKYGQTYPKARSVKITYVGGYTNGQSPDTDPLPFAIKAAMLLIVGNLYANRQEDQLGNTRISFNSLPMGVYNLIQPYRLGLGT